tara:strand:- start:3524 stop:3925 length:402 start_codon:yes stop_codon:yes gene_type:complete
MIPSLKKFISTKLFSQIIGFIIAGCTANFISFISYIYLFKVINFNIFASAILGQIFGVFTNYLVTSRFVFMKKLNFKMKSVFLIYYFTAIYLVGLLIEILNKNSIEYRLSWLIAVLIAMVCNFLFLKFIAYKR